MQPDKGWRCLSEASLARPRLRRASQLTDAQRRATNPARLSFGYFSLAKQRKVPRPPGRDPASPAGQAHRRAKARNSPQDPTNYPFAALIMSAAFSAIMITGALVLPATTLGMMGASNPLAQAHFSLEICVLVRLAPHWTRFNIDNKAILHYCLCIIQTTVKTP